MNCPVKSEQQEILHEYCAGRLDRGRSAELEKHSAGCAECSALIAAQSVLWQALDQWTPAEVSTNFDARLYERIAAEAARKPSQRLATWWSSVWGHSVWKPALAAAGAMAVLVIALVVRIPQGAPAAGEAVDMDQIEHALEDMDLLTPSPESSPM